MRSLDEINEKLYIDISRLHRYEEFMDAKKAEEVANNIFEDYKQEVEIYKEQKKLQREKILYEVRALTRALKPRAFLGLFKSRTAKLSNAQLAAIEKEYCDIYMPSREVYETLNAETEIAEADENGAAEQETEATEPEAAAEPMTGPEEPTEAPAPAPEAAEPTEPGEEEEVIFDDGEDEEEAEEPADKPTDEQDEDDGDGDGDGEEEETSEEGEHGEVSEFGESQ